MIGGYITNIKLNLKSNTAQLYNYNQAKLLIYKDN